MEQARDILRTAFRRMKDPEAAPAWLIANWPTIAGQRIAGHTRPGNLRSGVFCIQADSLAWKHQVETMGHAISERVNRAWGGKLVQSVVVEETLRCHKLVSFAEDNHHIPFVRSQRTKRHED